MTKSNSNPGGGSKGSVSQSSGSVDGNWPSTTGKPSGGGRSNVQS